MHTLKSVVSCIIFTVYVTIGADDHLENIHTADLKLMIITELRFLR